MLVVTVALVMAAMVLGAGPLFAEANPQANCVGAEHSNQREPGDAGRFHRVAASTFGVNGEIVRDNAHLAEPGPDRHTLGDLQPGSVSCTH
jgi:hypothetical protein